MKAKKLELKAQKVTLDKKQLKLIRKLEALGYTITIIIEK